WVIGDSGECSFSAQGCIDAGAVRDEYLAYAQGTGGKADVWLMLGDNAYNAGTDLQYTEGLFEVYPGVQRNTVLWPVPGNHDYATSGAAPYFAAFSLPAQGEAGGAASGSEAFYSFDYANVHFIALDSHGSDRTATGAMYTWLEADLMATSADWVIAFWHHPPYTKGSHDSDNMTDSSGRLWDMRGTFVPLLESYGVDLQLTGHSHSYERSMLIDGHYGTSDTFDPQIHARDTGDGDPGGDGAYGKPTLGLAPHEGAVYSVVGSSSKNHGGSLDHAVMKTSINYEGSMVIDVDGSVLEAVFVDKDGVIGDRFRIEKPALPAALSVVDEAAAVALAGLLLVTGCALAMGPGPGLDQGPG
ncbi:MAG: metallophosphoesterase, partial [Deltaproteobacteria bacterium]|nr:metallophosphoesterase [Deltaproteobacteria bacterium]